MTGRAPQRPEVCRYRYPSLAMAQGHTNKGTVYVCHERDKVTISAERTGRSATAVLTSRRL